MERRKLTKSSFMHEFTISAITLYPKLCFFTFLALLMTLNEGATEALMLFTPKLPASAILNEILQNTV